jgi:hypothetical protein
MSGLIETAIERETERLDQIMETANIVPPFFSPGHFRSRLNPVTGKFDARVTSRRRFSTRTAIAPPYLQ